VYNYATAAPVAFQNWNTCMVTQQPTSDEVRATWHECCAKLRGQLSPAVYNTWIVANPLTNLENSSDTQLLATIMSPTAFHSTNVKKNFDEALRQTLSEITRKQVEMVYVVGEASQQNESVPRSTELQPSAVAKNGVSKSPRVEDLFSPENLESAAVDRSKLHAKKVGLRTDYTFETFAVSTSNEMAHAAAVAVSNQPGSSYNPLFLYGGVGVGKTHLMHAIGNNIIEQNPQIEMIYSTGEEFTNQIVQAIQTKKVSHFKDKYRSTQVLFIDDIQFIAGKTAVQEEFFHTFNALTKHLKQVVLTSDRPPHEIRLLEDRLRSRFEAGLMIDIQEPSFELRTAILLLKSKAQGIPISIDLAKTIAESVDSARKIEGIITSIRSEVELKKRTLTPELIAEIISHTTQQERRITNASPTDIIKLVANHFQLSQAVLKGKSRVKQLVTARHIAMFLLKNELSLPLTEIGRWFSGRDHTSVLHATRKVELLLLSDSQLQRDILSIRRTLQSMGKN